MAKRTKRGRRRRLVQRASVGIKTSGVQLAAGVAGAAGAGLLASRVGFLQGHWWAPALAMAVGGHLLQRRPKMRTAGAAIVGAAGATGYMGYMFNRAAPPQQTQGFDAGALMGHTPAFADAGALIDGGYDRFAPGAAVAEAMGL